MNQVQPATDSQRSAIVALLEFAGLPVSDLPQSLEHFFTTTHNGRVTGVIGLEIYSQFALLRSLAVHPDYRNRQIALALVRQLEELAVVKQIQVVYLLTETAGNYFKKLGYETIDRKKVPEVLFKSTEFSHLCPASALVMQKQMKS